MLVEKSVLKDYNVILKEIHLQFSITYHSFSSVALNTLLSWN